MTGAWMQQAALGWLVYQLTGSAFYLGLIGSLSMVPSFLTAPVVGVIADKFDRRKIAMLMQVLTVIHAVAFALLVWTNLITIGLVIAFGILLGVVQGFDWPTRQSLVVELIDQRSDLGNAIALNSTVYNLARIVGPSTAGLILASGHGSWCFFLNAAACSLALLFMSRVRTSRHRVTPQPIEFVKELRAGAAYAWREPVIRRGLLLVALASGCIMPYAAMLPLFAAEVFHGDAKLYGRLSAAPAVGAVMGGLLLASRRDQSGLPQRILCVGLLASVILILFALSRSLTLSLAALVVLGGAMMMWTSTLNTQLQTAVVEQKRGRVMGFFNMAFMGGLPLGYFCFGWAAEHLGVAATVALGGVAGLAGNAWLHRGVLVRPALLLRRELA